MPKPSKSYDMLSVAAEMALAGLGQRLQAARLARAWSRELVAEKTGMSAGTIVNIEKGSPRVNIGCYLSLVDLYGLLGTLSDVADPAKDEIGRANDMKRLRGSARDKRSSDGFEVM